jgi:two-component system, cell cycle sensor histidine kinase and response regulator CckA
VTDDSGQVGTRRRSRGTAGAGRRRAAARRPGSEVQAALFEISEAAHAAEDLEALYRRLHAIVARLMPAENIYIALFDEASGMVSYPYYVDQVDSPPTGPEPLGRGLTAYVLRTGRPLLATPDVFAGLLAAGEAEELGAPSLDWLGVPLKLRDRTIGVLTVQSYSGGVRYGESERDLLAYVSTQVAQAIARKQAESEVRESQRMLATLISNLPGIAYRCRNDAEWTMEFISEGCQELTGYRPADLVDNAVISYDRVVHPDDRHRLHVEVDRALDARRPYELEYRIVTADGRTRWVWERGRGVWGTGGELEALEGFITDVTQARVASEALRQSEELYRLFFTHAPMGLMHFNAAGEIADCNARFCEIIGAPRDKLIGFSMVREVRDAGIRQALMVAMSGGVGRHEGHYASVLSGKVTPVAVLFGPLLGPDGAFLGGVCMVEDITERERTQRALFESEERYRLAMQATLEVMYDWDLGTGRILWNPNVLQVLGYTMSEVGSSLAGWVELIHPEERDRVEAELETALAGREGFESEYRLRRKTGDYAFIVNHGLILRDPGGRAVRMVGAMSDHTTRHNLELQLNQAQKMEAVGQLAGGIAHDFNNLLTAIQGSTELLRRNHPPGETGSGELNTIIRACERAAELTRGLLAYARRQVLATSVLHLNDVVEPALPLLRRMIPENIAISFNTTAEPLTVRGDRGQLTQIVVNLCVNARDAMPHGGALSIATSQIELDEGFTALHPGLAAGRHCLLTVSDTGRGIAAEDLPHVFEPFYTTKGLGHGSGLGLAVVYGIVKQHGGGIYVYSEPGRGTTVKIYLPLADGTPVAQETVARGPTRGGSETILVVEDEDEVRGVLSQILGGLGYTVLDAADGLQALELLTEDLGRIDLVLTDVVMPGLGGKELYRAVREMGDGPAFLFSSGYAESLVRDGLGDDVAVAFLGKPYGIDALAARVRELLDVRAHTSSAG